MKKKNKRIFILIGVLLILGTHFTSKNIFEERNQTINIAKQEEKNSTKNTIAAYVIQDDGTYKEVKELPQNGYQINTEKSICNNGAKPSGALPNIKINNLTKGGTSCYLYFDKSIPASKVIAKIISNAKTETPDFSQVATTDEGIYGTEDGMYGGTSYYWRGAATTNYIKFAGYCWRIVRVNGDSTLRLIYDGTACHQNGEITIDNIAKTNVQYNLLNDKAYYAGWTYETIQRTLNGTSSNAKTQLEYWYSINLINNETKIDKNAKYCNDRNVQSGSTWAATGSTFFYAGDKRLYTDYKPTLECYKDDIYKLKIGLITADEVAFAGGTSKNNYNYYLYNGQNYWSMTPSYWHGGYGIVSTFFVRDDGFLYSNSNNSVSWENAGIRPVINLRADVTFSGGDGTIDNPYVVAD